MKTSHIGTLFLLAILGTAGCDFLGLGDDARRDGLSLEVLRTNWERSDTIQVRLRNNTEGAVGYNLCSKVLERRVGNRWVTVQSMPENWACTAILLSLQPGAEAFGIQVIHPFIAGGTYRFRTSVEWPNGEWDDGLTSNRFVIADP